MLLERLIFLLIIFFLTAGCAANNFFRGCYEGSRMYYEQNASVVKRSGPKQPMEYQQYQSQRDAIIKRDSSDNGM